ncbi:MAG: acyl carrier protein [Myxococcales bacterium]|nr:acyl carrier protein [Myxococcales bacterium]
MDLNEKVTEIVADIFELDETEVADELTPDMVDIWDSLSQLRLVTAIEQDFDIKLSMDEIESIDSVGRLKRLVAEHVKLS